MNYKPRTLLLATKNPGKIEEIRLLLTGLNVGIRTGLEMEDLPDVEETEDTLEGNARLKAEILFQLTGIPTLSDDTGLEVAALGGEPGVRSARFAGEESDPARNRALLLERLSDQVDRRARFRTVVAFADETGTHLFEGTCTGDIVHRGRGTGGFGYDELFEPDGYELTFAELDVETKNEISHRGKALKRFSRFLRKHWTLEAAT